MKYIQDEIFHIIHKAIWLINEKRSENNKIVILDREIGEATEKIFIEDIKNLLYERLKY